MTHTAYDTLIAEELSEEIHNNRELADLRPFLRKLTDTRCAQIKRQLLLIDETVHNIDWNLDAWVREHETTTDHALEVHDRLVAKFAAEIDQAVAENVAAYRRTMALMS